MNIRILPLTALPLLLASCNVQESSPAPAPEAVVLAPRFAATASVPATDSVTVILKTESGEHDTARTVAYVQGGPITLGALPVGMRFTIAMTGWSKTDSGKVATWWMSTKDSSGSSVVHEVQLPEPQQSPAPLSLIPLIADSCRTIRGGDTILYQGKPVAFPAGTWITTDGSDPRTNPNALPAGSSYVTDSVTLVRVAVKTDSDAATNRPALWSPVKTIPLMVDPLDTLTSLDTLFLSPYKKLIDDSLINPVIQTPSPVGSARTDSLDHVWFDPESRNPSKLYLYAAPSSSRATIQAGTTAIPLRTFTEIPFPEDSTLEVVVSNHGRTGHSSVTFVRVRNWSDSDFHAKVLNKLASSSPGLMQSLVDKNTYSITLPADQDSLVLIPAFDTTFFAKIGDRLWNSGDSISVEAPLSAASIGIDIVSGISDANPVHYAVLISRAKELDFLDTTYGVPWRKVAYDTLVDARNSIKYRTVVVGKARWMAENLRYKRDTTFCPGNSLENCTKYGRLYRWYSAADTVLEFDYKALAIPAGPFKGVCPTGWHLPSRDEWQDLLTTLGVDSASNLLRSTGGSWTIAGGQDAVGMRVLPAGRRFVTYDTPRDNGEPHILYELLGTDTWFWTSTQGGLDAKDAVALRFSQTSPAAAFEENTRKSGALSVRCVSDTAVAAP